MKKEYFLHDEWKVIEDGFDPEQRKVSESIFSLGNEHMGLRGYFEEDYTGSSLQGSYIAGVYFPDPTKVGWWKNGYPEFFAKVINSVNWVGVKIKINNELLDLAKGKVTDYQTSLDMRTGLLQRQFSWTGQGGNTVKAKFERFLSMADVEAGGVKVTLEVVGGGQVELEPYLNGDVVNQDSNYGEKFWDSIDQGQTGELIYLETQSKKTEFRVLASASCKVSVDPKAPLTPTAVRITDHYASQIYQTELKDGEVLQLEKLASILTSRDHSAEELQRLGAAKTQSLRDQGWEQTFQRSCEVWEQKWQEADVVINGDVAAQQGIRYNIFQLFQTYGGRDDRLNIGPKGFTGEKYGGCTYWDTEAFCFPLYLYTNKEVARNLLVYRYHHLERAKENAQLLGLKGALYPMVTIDGRECHNEWEITFEEIHRNGAIAYAIYHYAEYTGDNSYTDAMGIDVLCEIARFWASRSSYSERKQQYVILGVTGPNEYENNVNNNWYTNMLAKWCMSYAGEQLARIKQENATLYGEIVKRLDLQEQELSDWKTRANKMYFPRDEELDIFMQQDGYMDKEQKVFADLEDGDYPLHKNWSWDRILRSAFIKQADVLQGFYLFPKLVDKAELQRSFDFYEPRTVHESSLSPSVYSIMASIADYEEKAYELYLRTARLDLDNYNHDTDDGCHITSMVGSWLAIVQGFAGLRFEDNRLSFRPKKPANWEGYSFKINYRDKPLQVAINAKQLEITSEGEMPLEIFVYDKAYSLSKDQPLQVDLTEEK